MWFRNLTNTRVFSRHIRVLEDEIATPFFARTPNVANGKHVRHSDRLIIPLLGMAAISSTGCVDDSRPDAQLVIPDVTLLAAPGEPAVTGATLVFEHERVSAILTHGEVPPPAKAPSKTTPDR